jgi:hypothetical protein
MRPTIAVPAPGAGRKIDRTAFTPYTHPGTLEIPLRSRSLGHRPCDRLSTNTLSLTHWDYGNWHSRHQDAGWLNRYLAEAKTPTICAPFPEPRCPVFFTERSFSQTEFHREFHLHDAGLAHALNGFMGMPRIRFFNLAERLFAAVTALGKVHRRSRAR